MRGIAILQDGSIATMEPVYTKHGNVMEKLIALTDLMNGIAQFYLLLQIRPSKIPKSHRLPP